MSKNFSRIKAALSTSTTLPIGSGGGPSWLEGHHHGHHEHNADGSCCGHDHHEKSDDHTAHFSKPTEDDIEEECEHDHTSPKGGCGCC